MVTPDLMLGLPGEELVREGLADFQSGRCTIPACLVSMARPRLRRAGLITGRGAGAFPEPERQLYRLLGQEGGDAYSRYNALVRELVSFEQALDRRQAGGRGTEDGGRGTGDGRRRTEDGGRRTEDGGRRAEDGGRRTEDGRRRTEDGGRTS